MRHQQRLVIFLTVVMIALLWFTFSNNELQIPLAYQPPSFGKDISSDNVQVSHDTPTLNSNQKNTEMESIMPKMPDPEAKKELGRSSWKYFHTLLARFPDTPTEDEKNKLRQFIHLYAELYPCGECSYHFVKLLGKYPPQVASRTSAALWGCHIHNLVNEHLGKDEYDCTTILEDYDCGCTDENGEIDSSLKLNNKITLEKEKEQLG